jgi:hypothetical protein
MERTGTTKGAFQASAATISAGTPATADASNTDVDDNVTVANMHSEASAINANNDPMAAHDWS